MRAFYNESHTWRDEKGNIVATGEVTISIICNDDYRKEVLKLAEEAMVVTDKALHPKEPATKD